QQLAGLLMWVPAGVILAAAGLTFLAAWIRESGRRVRSGWPTVAGVLLLLPLAAGAAGCQQRTGKTPSAGPAPQGHPAGAPAGMHLVGALPHDEWRMPAGDYGS